MVQLYYSVSKVSSKDILAQILPSLVEISDFLTKISKAKMSKAS